MSDFINKVVTIILIFMLLVMGPLIMSYKTEEMLAKRLILNDVTSFIDKVKDTAIIAEDDLDKLYVDCNSHGIVINVAVKKLIRTEISKEGKIATVYYAVDSLEGFEEMHPGDVVKVYVTEVGISSSRRITYNILKIDEGKFKFSLAGTVG